jgi:hypothetical protein
MAVLNDPFQQSAMMKRAISLVLLVSTYWTLRAQSDLGHILELGSGSVVRSFNGKWPPHYFDGISLMPVDSAQGDGYFVSAGWGGYSPEGGDLFRAFIGFRVRYEQVKYTRRETGEKFSPSSFFRESFSYTAKRTIQSIGISVPLMVAIRPAPCSEVRLGFEISVAGTVGDQESSELITTVVYYTPPWSVSHTSTDTTEFQHSPDIPSKFQFMLTGTLGYRQRIGRFQFGPDVIYPLSDLSTGLHTPWGFALWVGYCL